MEDPITIARRQDQETIERLTRERDEARAERDVAEAKLFALRQAVDRLDLPHNPNAPGRFCQLRDLKVRLDAARSAGKGGK